jgi:outer membrane lipoprotein-sorting protein
MSCAPTLRKPALDITEDRWDVIQAVLKKNYNKIKNFHGSGKLLVESPDYSYSADSKVLVKNPDSVYVKVEAIFGLDVGVLFADREYYLIYTPMQNIYYTGSTDSLNLQKFISFNLNYDDLIESLLGLELALDFDLNQIKQVGQSILLVGKKQDNTVAHWVNPEYGVITKSTVVNGNKQVVLKAEYDRFSITDGVVIPKTIRILRPLRKESLTLFYRMIKINKDLSKDDFKVKIPDSARRLVL